MDLRDFGLILDLELGINLVKMPGSNLSVAEILEGWIQGREPSSEDWEQLLLWELRDSRRVKAFGIAVENTRQQLQTRSHLFLSVVEAFQSFSLSSTAYLESLWDLWLPLALQLRGWHQALNRPLIQGILGGQGTGKTTLAKGLKLILERLEIQTVTLSLDDLYKTYAERERLKQLDPRLIWRGPPGTHDLDLGITVLDQLRQAKSNPTQDSLKKTLIEIPRFDKSAKEGAGDRREPELIEQADIVLFEGWFVGVKPLREVELRAGLQEKHLPPIVTEVDRQFALDMNAQLHSYLPLWDRLDKLIVLYPENYRLSQQWRRQAEQEMKAAGKSGMADAEIDQFVDYFWKALHPELFITPLIEQAQGVDLVIEIKADRSVNAIYRPEKIS